jgi:two-component system phosphate regulon response regulator OmpR
MADINVNAKTALVSASLAERPAGGAAPTSAVTDPTWDIIELLFFAYRDFVGDPDEVLSRLAFGRAHHRVLHFVNRNPGMKVADLLDILNITKQSLGRVLKQLVDQGFVVQKEGAQDRRQRLLYVTPKGETLALKLAGFQTTRIERAFAELGPGAHEAARRCSTLSRAPTVLQSREAEMPSGSPAAVSDDAPHLLVVDDDRRIRDLLSRFLAGEGYRVSTAETAADARAKLVGLSFDLLILDVMMPGESGFDLAKSIRGNSNVPILMLTARDAAESRIKGLEMGADDYLSKPFEPRELSLRIASILKRTQPAATPPVESVRFGPFVYHLNRGELRKGEEIIRLTDREREMLRILSATPGETVARLALAGNGGTISERAVDVQVNRLRRKIERNPANPMFVQTVRGIGYRLVVTT